jgi:hypothetical protein
VKVEHALDGGDLMRTFYFVGGPTPGHRDEFFGRLAAAGGTPPGWQISPHAGADGKALHIVQANSEVEIAGHLAQFADIYDATPPVELVDTHQNGRTEEAHTGA